MWSRSKKDCYVRLVLLLINCAACIAIIYIFITYASEEDNKNKISTENSIRSEKLTDEQCTQVCDSKACIWHANMFLRNINASADPCENFGSFLCSRFTEEYGPDENANVLKETEKHMITRLQGILDNIEAEPGSASAKMKTVYDSCVDYGSSELQGIKDLKNFFSCIGIFNWPDLPEDFSFNDVKLSEILANLIVSGPRNYITLLRKDRKESSFVLVTFENRDFNKTTILNQEMAISILKYFDLEAKDMDVIIKDYDLIRNAILKLYQDYGTCQNKSCYEAHIDCVRQKDDNWHELCETLRFLIHFNDSIESYPIAFTKPEDIFFKELFSHLHSFPNRTLANFVALNLIRNFQTDLNFYFRLSKFKQKDFESATRRRAYSMDRRKFCVRWITWNMKLPLQNEFFHQYLTNSTTEELSNIFKYYSSAITELVNLQNWNTTLKLKLTEQIESIPLNIDIMKEFFPNDTYVNKVYEKFFPTRKSFFDNVLRIKRHNPIIRTRNLSLKERATYLADFEVSASGWIPIDIDFGMLLPPFFIPGHIKLINRVLLAPIIGHEFGHLIYMMIEDNASDLKKFLDERQCIRDQFSRFKFQYLNENLNGSRYDIENVPDNVATSVIDKVIEKYSSSQDTQFILPGMPYSVKQLLYMSSIQMWCAKSDLKQDLHFKLEDHHAPPEYRFIGMMQNSKGHSKAFNCPEGSFMNPSTKCALLDTNSI